MRLLVSVPAGVLVDEPVVKIIAESDFGSFALLPRHADLAALLVPGLLAYHLEDGSEIFMAVDHGLLVKAGEQVRVACQRAVVAGDLGAAEETVRERFKVRTDTEKRARRALVQLEGEILKRVLELRHR